MGRMTGRRAGTPAESDHCPDWSNAAHVAAEVVESVLWTSSA
jgi:hypothetical protein